MPRVAVSEARACAFGRYVFRLPQRIVEKDGQPIHLGSRAVDILERLLLARGALVSAGDLQQAVWSGAAIDESALRVHLSHLRRALAEHDPGASYIQNVPGRGYRLVCELRELNEESRPPPPPRSARTGARTTVVHGREAAIEHLERLLSEHRFVTITGPGGIGKTTVALAVADAREASGTRVHFVDFAAVSTPSQVISAIAMAVGVGVTSDDPVPRILAALDDGDEDLLILDNCEHLPSAIAGIAERLLAGAKHLCLLATSRETLRAEGEWVHRLQPLAVPDETMPLADAIGAPSVALFAERAQAVWADFTLSADNVGEVSEICRQLDGLPLAIEFAAARLDVLDARDLLARLKDRFSLLSNGRRTAIPRQRTLRATMDWSYELLAADEKMFLRRLGVFHADFDLKDAIAVAGAGADEYAGIEQIRELCAKSLIVAERSGATIRYRLLDTTRHYAVEKLAEEGETDATFAQLAGWCLAAMREIPPPAAADERKRWLADQEYRLADIRGAIAWCFEADRDVELAIQLVLAAAPLWFFLSLSDEFGRVTRQALDVLPGTAMAGTEVQVQLLCSLGQAAYHSQWPPVGSSIAYGQALALARTLDDSAIGLRALWGLWANHTLRGDYEQSFARAREFAVTASAADLEPVHGQTGLQKEAFAVHLNGAQGRAQQLIDAVADEQGRPGAVGIPSYNQIYGVLMEPVVRARTLWVRGLADQALSLAAETGDALLAGGHDLTICTNFAVGIVPIHLWCGNGLGAVRLLDRLDHFARRNGNQHWIVWVQGFRTAIEGHPPPGYETGLQIDTGLTLGRPDALEKAIADGRHLRPSWCQAEMLRLMARDGDADEDIVRLRLGEAYVIAEANGELAWQLRIATDLARLDRAAGGAGGAGAGAGVRMLRETLERVTEGRTTPDYQAALKWAGL
jgi:predicted ATPase/DNA-binding winged helix-turn-helix (wHTH) protein